MPNRFAVLRRGRLLVLLALVCVSMACSSMTQHENFLAHMELNIGKDYERHDGQGMAAQNFVQSKTLPDGNVEREYKYRRSCKLFFTVNPVTRIVLNWRYEGSDSDCAIPL